MTYHHPSYSASYKHDSPSYALSTAGDVAATIDYMTKADLPGYTTRFYSPSEHEQFSDVKYDKLLVNYDKDFAKFREAVMGPDLIDYIPHSFPVILGSSPSGHIVAKPSDETIKEIEEATRKAKGAEVVIIDTIIDQLIVQRKRIKKREIIIKKRDEKENKLSDKEPKFIGFD